MKLRLTRNYTGPYIDNLPAGVYDAADPRLNGRAAYLVGIEVAAWVEGKPAAPEPQPEPEPAADDASGAQSDDAGKIASTSTRRRRKGG